MLFWKGEKCNITSHLTLFDFAATYNSSNSKDTKLRDEHVDAKINATRDQFRQRQPHTGPAKQ